jgi:hypothetical protein
MPYEFYKFIHLIGIGLTLMSIAAIIPHMIGGGSKATLPFRKQIAMSHGIGLLLTLLGGFGALAKLGFMSPLPGWAIGKLVIWFAFGGLLPIAYRKPEAAKALWITAIVMLALAAYLALYKPF